MLRILTAASLFMPLVAYSDVNVCARPVVVAVIDTGVDIGHSDIQGHLWINRKETLADKTDNDKNGYVDDKVGYDFVNETPIMSDTHGHGTHVAGIVLGTAYGRFGQDFGWQKSNAFDLPPYLPKNCYPDIRIMSLKYYSNGGQGYNNLSNTVRALDYAVANGADIINYSGGGADSAASERAAVKRALDKGILVVAAAGNDGRNNDRRPYYPASYDFDNIIAVAGVNKFGILMPSSNFGTTVDVAAPGLMVLSTLPENHYGTMSGTSQATPFVSGLAALMMTMQPKRDYVKVRDAIIKSGVRLQVDKMRQILKTGIVDPSAAINNLK